MKYSVLLLAMGMASTQSGTAIAKDPLSGGSRLQTYANPVNLPYRYQPQKRAYREAADPTLIRFHGLYWLFASHSKGYWYSRDLLNWTFVQPTGFDVDKYAPTVFEMDGKLYLATSENVKKIWVAEDPIKGTWREAGDISGYGDPCLFLDDDGRLYVYEGLSATNPLRVVELDRKTFLPIRETLIKEAQSKETRGWEVTGDNNQRVTKPTYTEGSWMTKYKGRYYLQYAAPGTEYKTYADGVLVSDNPMGPFVYQAYSPFSFKPTGFIAGAGHGSTVHASGPDWWHVSTMSIARRHPYERRIGLFPAGFNSRGELFADTYLGDYPHYVNGTRALTGWMLLSRGKPVTASSSLEGMLPERAVDEEVRTWWSARTGDAGEWLQVDLEAIKRVEALQVNFADQDSEGKGISTDAYRYVVEGSADGKRWHSLVAADRTGRDAPHDYQVLKKADRVRYIKIRNLHSPDNGKFSLSDLRVFGQSNDPLPGTTSPISAVRDTSDPRRAMIRWNPSDNAQFYIVRIGVTPDLLSQNYQVYDGRTELNVGSLTKGIGYFYAVDAVNERGITKGTVRPIEGS